MCVCVRAAQGVGAGEEECKKGSPQNGKVGARNFSCRPPHQGRSFDPTLLALAFGLSVHAPPLVCCPWKRGTGAVRVDKVGRDRKEGDSAMKGD
jgi:hypothetical protein